jgi:hypothetical protein
MISKKYMPLLLVLTLSACTSSYEQRRPVTPVPGYPGVVYQPMPTDPGYRPLYEQPGAVGPGGYGELIGAPADWAGNNLRSQGFTMVRQEGSTTYWSGSGGQTCLMTVTRNGVYDAVDQTDPVSCEAASALGSPSTSVMEEATPLPTGRTGSAADENTCLRAVALEARAAVSVLSSGRAEGGTLVIIGVGAEEAPWRCVVSGGEVKEIASAGSAGRF